MLASSAAATSSSAGAQAALRPSSRNATRAPGRRQISAHEAAEHEPGPERDEHDRLPARAGVEPLLELGDGGRVAALAEVITLPLTSSGTSTPSRSSTVGAMSVVVRSRRPWSRPRSDCPRTLGPAIPTGSSSCSAVPRRRRRSADRRGPGRRPLPRAPRGALEPRSGPVRNPRRRRTGRRSAPRPPGRRRRASRGRCRPRRRPGRRPRPGCRRAGPERSPPGRSRPGNGPLPEPPRDRPVAEVEPRQIAVVEILVDAVSLRDVEEGLGNGDRRRGRR